MSAERRPLYILAALGVLAGVGMRLFNLGGDSLWHDEAFTWYFTRMNWGEMLDTVRLDGVNPPIFYITTKVLVGLLGDSEWVLRGVSAIAGTLAIAAAWLLGRVAGGRIGAWTAAVFIALHPMAIHYSRDARPYALVLLLSLVLVYLYFYLRVKPSMWAWIAVWAVLAAGQLSHYFFFVLGGTIVFLALAEMRARPLAFRKWAIVWLSAFIPLGGWLWWYMAQPTPALGIGWIERPEVSAIPGTIWNLFSGYGGSVTAAASLFGGGAILAATFGLAAGQGWKETGNEWLVWILFPVLAVWLVSQRRPVYIDRYFIIMLPAAAYLSAKGARVISQEWRKGGWKWLLPGMTILTITSGFMAGWGVHQDAAYSREDWRGLVSYLSENRGADEQIWLSEPEASIPIQYYLRGDLGVAISSDEPLQCISPCWWIMRQPFTATHAFSQSVGRAGSERYPVLPANCLLLGEWTSDTGVAAWRLVCD